jgi:choline-sulfatase
LFDLEADPDELENLTDHPRLEAFRAEAAAHWDSDVVRAAVIHSQERRRAVHAALRHGRYQGWDFNPARNASEEYTRSHMDLTRFDYTSRYPRPPAFEPRWK